MAKKYDIRTLTSQLLKINYNSDSANDKLTEIMHSFFRKIKNTNDKEELFCDIMTNINNIDVFKNIIHTNDLYVLTSLEIDMNKCFKKIFTMCINNNEHVCNFMLDTNYFEITNDLYSNCSNEILCEKIKNCENKQKKLIEYCNLL